MCTPFWDPWRHSSVPQSLSFFLVPAEIGTAHFPHPNLQFQPLSCRLVSACLIFFLYFTLILIFFPLSHFIFIHYWSLAALQCCLNCCTHCTFTVQQSESAVRTHIFPLPWMSFPFRSHRPLSSLCYTIGSH